MKTVFVGGCGRSGTTLLGAQLGSHPEILATPESRFITNVLKGSRRDGQSNIEQISKRIRQDPLFRIWGVSLDRSSGRLASNYADLVKSIVLEYGDQREKSNPAFWVDHTPRNIVFPATLDGLFPDSKLIHIIRDGRAVGSSVLPLDWGPNTVSRAARWWTSRVGLGLASEARFGAARAIRIHFENLVQQPEATLREVCEFIEIGYDASMMAGGGFEVPSYTVGQHRLVGQLPDPARVEAWRTRLSSRQIEVFESIAGEVLACFGYEPQFGLHPKGQSASEAVKDLLYEQYRIQLNAFRHRRRLRTAIR